MNPLAPLLDDYALLGTPEGLASAAELVERYPWFTLARVLELRGMRSAGMEASREYRQRWRNLDVRLFVHPFPQVLLPESRHAGHISSTLAAIDQFLANGPGRIVPTPGGSERENAEDLSVASSTVDPEVASETLAEIYLAQGEIERAVEIYSRLGLKYPEKSGYFADRIAAVLGR